MNNYRAGSTSLVLRNRNFLVLWVSQLVSKIGDNLVIVAALVLVNELAAKSGLAVVVMATAMTIPQLFALASGVFLDRFSRKTIMIACDLLRAGVVLTPILVTKPGQLWVLYLTAFVLMSLSSMYIPARNASIPNMVPEEQLLTANALMQATELVSLIAGAALATLVISLTSTSTAFALDSLTFVTSALLLTVVRIPQGQPSMASSGSSSEFRRFWLGFSDGIRYVRSNKPLLNLMALTTVATLGLSATVLVAAAYFKQLLNMSPQYLGLLQAAQGVGMALGALMISVYASWARSRRIVSVTMIVLGCAILLYAFAPVYWLILFGAVVVGLCVVSARTSLAAMSQALVPDGQRGRVESAMVTVIGIGTMGSLVMAGILGDLLGPRVVFAITGLIVLFAGVMSIFALREAERQLLNEM